jgi:hypothetical protein
MFIVQRLSIHVLGEDWHHVLVGFIVEMMYFVSTMPVRIRILLERRHTEDCRQFQMEEY